MIFLVFDKINSEKATFFVNGIQIKPVVIKNDLLILQVELEQAIMNHDPTIIYEKREVLDFEFPSKIL